jgi:D-alanyl-lipoteichoic acid acyltransferase DltB (MBOAT superfamily)
VNWATSAALDRAGDEARARGGIGIANFLLIGMQLGLVLLLFRQFQIESAAFLRLALLAFGGFAIHAFLPLAYRLPFFVLLSLAGIAVVMGVANAAWLVGLGLLLIGICHLPVSFARRVALTVAVGTLLIVQRATLLPAPWSQAIWPILGSMFMFRLIVYLYDLRHEKAPASPAHTLAYFFMLPNACFPLFPVVDYQTFRRNYYDDDAYRIYQVGVDWMVRGVVHLILYRVVYYHFTLAPFEVTGPSQLTQYLVANFLLYLRVSGLFHLIVGMLHLFGFRLPETHNRYLLASSFTDFWRRINIYWKDFMQKLFFYPAVFKLRKFGTTPALVLATLYVFLMTWFLHAYQWCWLRGSTLLVWQDVLFWTILGLLVVANSLYEIKHGRRRSLGTPVRNWRSVLVTALKTCATFWAIAVLWSFWTADSLSDWLSLWQALRGEYGFDVLLIPLLVLALAVLGSTPRDTVRNLPGSQQGEGSWLRARAVTLVCLTGLIVISIEGVSRKLGAEVATFVHSLRSGQLSRLDTAKLERGYYENLLSVDRFNSQLWEVYMKKPANWLDVENANLKRFVDGFARSELIPSFVSNTKYGVISINRFGMRDREYDPLPAPGTYRAVVLGASSVMGWGVSDGRTFEALVEQRLNAEKGGLGFERYELLNLGVPGYEPPQQLLALDKAMSFAPQAVFYVAAGREIGRAARSLVTAIREGIEIPYEPLRDILRTAGVDPRMDEATAIRLLAPHREEILSYVYGEIAQRCRERGIVPVWIFVPQARAGAWVEETPATVEIAEAAGFVVINLEDVYRQRELSSIRLAEWDDHPNARGHELIAQRLYEELVARWSLVVEPARRRALARNPVNSSSTK